MKNFATHIRLGLSAALLTAVSVTTALAADWRGWNIHAEGYPNTIALQQFIDDVEVATDGRIKGQVFNGGVLGSQPDAIEQIQVGAVDFANFNMGPMGPIVPKTNILSLPFLFKDVAQMHRAMDGEAGDAFSAAMEEKGIVALAWYDSGSRSLYNTKKPIMTPDDVKGMKFRVMNNDLYVDMINSLGGNATPMAFGEVFQSLKTGVIDGAENNYPSYESTNHFEAAKFYSITNHLIIPECLCIAKSSWDKLTAGEKKIVKLAAQSSAATQRRLWAVRSEASRMKVEEAGAKVNTVDDPAAFQKAMQPVYDKYLEANPDDKELIDKIQSM